MRVYEPTIINDEQRFTANIISVSKQLIAFGELLPAPGKALKFGTPIHSLLIHLDGDQTLFELNQQSNRRDTRDVARLEVTATTLRLVFAPGRGPYSGRVSLSRDIEIFERDKFAPQQVRSVLVVMRPTASQRARIAQLLASNKLVSASTIAQAISPRRGPTRVRRVHRG